MEVSWGYTESMVVSADAQVKKKGSSIDFEDITSKETEVGRQSTPTQCVMLILNYPNYRCRVC